MVMTVAPALATRTSKRLLQCPGQLKQESKHHTEISSERIYTRTPKPTQQGDPQKCAHPRIGNQTARYVDMLRRATIMLYHQDRSINPEQTQVMRSRALAFADGFVITSFFLLEL